MTDIHAAVRVATRQYVPPCPTETVGLASAFASLLLSRPLTRAQHDTLQSFDATLTSDETDMELIVGAPGDAGWTVTIILERTSAGRVKIIYGIESDKGSYNQAPDDAVDLTTPELQQCSSYLASMCYATLERDVYWAAAAFVGVMRILDPSLFRPVSPTGWLDYLLSG